MTLVNGRAADGGAIRGRSRNPAGLELTGTEAIPHVEATRLAIMGGAIRDCEATNDGGAIALIGEATMFGAAAVEVPPLSPPGLWLYSATRPRLAHVWHDAPAHTCSTPISPNTTTLRAFLHRSRQHLSRHRDQRLQGGESRGRLLREGP